MIQIQRLKGGLTTPQYSTVFGRPFAGVISFTIPTTIPVHDSAGNPILVNEKPLMVSILDLRESIIQKGRGTSTIGVSGAASGTQASTATMIVDTTKYLPKVTNADGRAVLDTDGDPVILTPEQMFMLAAEISSHQDNVLDEYTVAMTGDGKLTLLVPGTRPPTQLVSSDGESVEASRSHVVDMLTDAVFPTEKATRAVLDHHMFIPIRRGSLKALPISKPRMQEFYDSLTDDEKDIIQALYYNNPHLLGEIQHKDLTIAELADYLGQYELSDVKFYGDRRLQMRTADMLKANLPMRPWYKRYFLIFGKKSELEKYKAAHKSLRSKAIALLKENGYKNKGSVQPWERMKESWRATSLRAKVGLTSLIALMFIAISTFMYAGGQYRPFISHEEVIDTSGIVDPINEEAKVAHEKVNEIIKMHETNKLDSENAVKSYISILSELLNSVQELSKYQKTSRAVLLKTMLEVVQAALHTPNLTLENQLMLEMYKENIQTALEVLISSS